MQTVMNIISVGCSFTGFDLKQISLIPVYFQNRYSNIIPRSAGESSPYALSFESKNVIEFDFASTFS